MSAVPRPVASHAATRRSAGDQPIRPGTAGRFGHEHPIELTHPVSARDLHRLKVVRLLDARCCAVPRLCSTLEKTSFYQSLNDTFVVKVPGAGKGNRATGRAHERCASAPCPGCCASSWRSPRKRDPGYRKELPLPAAPKTAFADLA